MAQKIDVSDMAALNEGLKQRSHALPWYYDEIPAGSFHPKMRQILETYSGIPPSDVEKHVLEMRDKAFDVLPYPCIGRFTFIKLSVVDHPRYNELIERLKGGEKLLDVGCCFGHEVRIFVADGAPSENIYASDIEPKFLELGYELFKDKDKLKTKFMAADIFDANSPLMELKESLDIVHAGSFLHLFSWKNQKKVAAILIGLLKKRPGALILGKQLGSTKPGEYPTPTDDGGTMFRHDEASWRKMWEEVGQETGEKWKLDLKTAEAGTLEIHGREHNIRMYFSVERV